MFDPNQGPARELISPREQLDRAEFERLQSTGVLVIGDHTRPRYFDGRFLAARDLTREQNYFLTRQASLGRAGGQGVVTGLMVERGPNARSIQIQSGHGITAAGELVMLPNQLVIQLTDAIASQRLNSAFRISRIPNEPMRARSGLFTVALRPVEFTAGPIASYPTSITGERSVEDGDIVEGTAVVLIPYGETSGGGDAGQRRARVAYDLFVGQAGSGALPGVLPLALVALDLGVVQWVDTFLLRREVGAEHGDVLGLGFAPRARREAHLLQYEQHLTDVLNQRSQSNRGQRFAATEHFFALPPAGRMPVSAINPDDFTQLFFPPEVDVELSIIPNDELTALIDESLLLPPFDLTLTGEELESTAALVLLPVARARMRSLKDELSKLQRTLLPAAPGLVARRRPFEVLQNLLIARLPTPIFQPQVLADNAWRRELANATELWFIRRRNLAYSSDVVGVGTRVFADDLNTERLLVERLRLNKQIKDFDGLRKKASTDASAEMIDLLAAPKFELSPTLVAGAIGELAVQPQLDRATVAAVTARFADSRLGEGIARLESVKPALQTDSKLAKVLADSGVVPELDRLSRSLAPLELSDFADALAEAAATKDATQVRALIQDRLKEITR